MTYRTDQRPSRSRPENHLGNDRLYALGNQDKGGAMIGARSKPLFCRDAVRL